MYRALGMGEYRARERLTPPSSSKRHRRLNLSEPIPVRVFGRSSSVFTRCLRLVAHELGVPYELVVAADLQSQDPADYGGNPALKLPALHTESGVWFGALNGCRELARRAHCERDLVWPEELVDQLTANAQELVLQGMSTEVTLIMDRLSDEGRLATKAHFSLTNSLTWLDERLPEILTRLPSRRLPSILEVTLFCFVTHLSFRSVLETSGFVRLEGFLRDFGGRESARRTEYHFDPR